LQESVAIGRHLLASAFAVSQPAFLVPLREGYEAAVRQSERQLAVLSTAGFDAQVVPLFARLAALSVGPGGVFEVRARELEAAQRQGELLARNREITNRLVAEVEGLVEGFRSSTQFAGRTTANTIRTGQQLLLALNLISVAGAVLIAWLFVGRFLIRRLKTLSSRMRYMASGDLEGAVAISGHDEVADMAAALEVFRRHAFEVQRLNLVEKLAADLQSKNSELESVLADLRKAQDQIVMREKLAALGELTAGVAHEIKNPLNFVKNFAEVSEELLEELQEVLATSSQSMSAEEQEAVEDVCENLTESLESILQHGDRANRIVHDMLQMGRESSERLCVDINSLVREHAKLAFHSARATDPNFQVHIEEAFDEDLGEIECVPQALGRVVLNIVTNACHATDEKRQAADRSYNPTLWLRTQQVQDRARISVRDNGNGIPDAIREKIFNPFFTTKAADKGTGLGLALSNDIVREHGGGIRVDSVPGEFTEMIVELPLARGAA
jgi:signal transduction histidine kinase